MKKGVVILGSSRSNGNTATVVNYFLDMTGYDVIDLNKSDINFFDYDFKNKKDDFEIIYKNMVQNYQTIVFATPIYWYTMSGIMKTFFDRISDYLYQEKEYGRMLRGKEMAMISCSNADDRVAEFSLPFSRSAAYLGMEYKGDIHTWIAEEKLTREIKDKLDAFALKLK